MKPGFFQGKKFPFTPKRRKKSLGSQCNNIIDTRHDLAAFRSKLANVSWLRSYIHDRKAIHIGSHGQRTNTTKSLRIPTKFLALFKNSHLLVFVLCNGADIDDEFCELLEPYIFFSLMVW